MRLAARFDIPWCILSDGATDAIESVNRCLKKAGLPEHPANARVFSLPNGQDFEAYLAQSDYLDLLRDMITEFEATDKQLNARSKAECRKNLGKKNASDMADRAPQEEDYLWSQIAKALSLHPDPKKRVPQIIQDMLNAVWSPSPKQPSRKPEASRVS